MNPQTQAQIGTQQFTVEIVYNGLTKPLEVRPHETVHAALEKAMNLFGITNQRHLMAYFREDGSEVAPENITLEAANVAPGTVLALRPSRVKGGRA